MGIKNFQAPRKQQENTSDNTALKVSDYMTTNLITFTKDQTIENVMEALVKHRISGAPVVNEKNELIGIISEGDCMKKISDSRYYNMPIQDKTIEDYMSVNIETIDGNMNIIDAANEFLKAKRRRFPIVENGKLIGQISRKDVLKAAMELKGQNWK